MTTKYISWSLIEAKSKVNASLQVIVITRRMARSTCGCFLFSQEYMALQCMMSVALRCRGNDDERIASEACFFR